MARNTLVDPAVVKKKLEECEISDLSKATIREIVKLVNLIELATGTKYIRMELGIPGLDPPEIAVNAEINALKKGVASKYPNLEGIPEFKQEVSRFAKKFLDIDVDPAGCLPTVGSMQGSFATFIVANRNDHTRKGSLFIDPGFPVQKMQCKVLGHDYETFDIHYHRGNKLKEKVDSYLKTGKISSIVYSNPNNPTWLCLDENELRIIGELAKKYDVIVIEDLAYFGMDFRKDYSKPGQPPFQPTIAKYTDQYVLLISCSKSFSYAGQRIGMMIIANNLFTRRYPDLLRYYSSDMFGTAMILGALYALSAGASHSAQFGMSQLLKASNDGTFNFIEPLHEYGRRAKKIKSIFLNNGFKIVYDKDIDKPIADGFYFTICYPGLTGGELLEKLIYNGISAIAIGVTGSERTDGLRACVSLIDDLQIKELEKRVNTCHEIIKNI